MQRTALKGTSSTRIEVQELPVSASEANPSPHPPPRRSRNWSRIIGLAGTLSLHGLAIQSLNLGSGLHKAPLPEVQGAGALRVDSPAPAEELVLVTIADVKKDDAGLAEQVASLGPQLEKSSISILSPDPLPAMTIDAAEDAPDDSAQVAAETGDPAVRALMFGRYTGQISARIERAWRRPRSPVNELAQAEPPRVGIQEIASDIDEMFSCLVQIRQDARGNVEEVLLLKCNGTEDWRHSLVIAINQSSPLPAPPIPTVFTQSLTMTFEAHAYRPGKNPDDYEMEPMSVPPAIVATRPAEGRLNGEVHDR